jgi:hypothetical protein
MEIGRFSMKKKPCCAHFKYPLIHTVCTVHVYIAVHTEHMMHNTRISHSVYAKVQSTFPFPRMIIAKNHIGTVMCNIVSR